MKKVAVLTVLVSIVFFAGCSDDKQKSQSPNGIWYGTQTIDNTEYQIEVFVYDGTMITYSSELSSVTHGSLREAKTNTYTSLYSSFDLDGNYTTNGSLEAYVSNVADVKNFYGYFTDTLGDKGTLDTEFQDVYSNPSSLEYIAGTFNNDTDSYTIFPNGDIQGISDTCDFEGKVSKPNSNINMYEISLDVSSCASAGKYSGLGAILFDDTLNTYMQFIMSSSNHMMMLSADVSRPDTFN